MGTSTEDWRWKIGESGALLEKLMDAGKDDVDSSSSPAKSTGDDAVGVEDCEKIKDAGMLVAMFAELKFRSIARIESADDTFGRWFLRAFARNANSCKASSLLDRDSLP